MAIKKWKTIKMTEKSNNNFRLADNPGDVHRMLLHLLKKLHDICEDNQLIYNLANGTMLGAVRHQSFIPWDDDADVSMPRPDYEKFIKLVRENYSDYCILSYGDPDYPYPYAKFGFRDTILIEHALKDQYARSILFVDIFPMDGLPDEEEKQIKYISRLIKIKKKRYLCAMKPSLSPNPWKRQASHILNMNANLLSRFRGMEYFLRKEAEAAQRYSYTDSSWIFSSCHYALKSTMKKQDYLDRRKYAFDQYNFWGVRDHDRYLNKLYGDYMKLPPPEEQNPKHDYTLYVSENLYERIIKCSKI